MDKKSVLEALKKAREEGKKRNFSQSFELIINLKGLDLKKQEQQVDMFIVLPSATGKKARLCAFVGSELAADAKTAFDKVITDEEFESYSKNKKQTKRLAKEFDFFIAQANLMAKVASVFGRYLGPKGKMPNPKAGGVVAPKAPLKPVVERLQRTVKASAKTVPIVQCIIGKESLSDDELAANALAVYESVVHHLPSEERNLKSVMVKLTMGKPVRVK